MVFDIYIRIWLNLNTHKLDVYKDWGLFISHLRSNMMIGKRSIMKIYTNCIVLKS